MESNNQGAPYTAKKLGTAMAPATYISNKAATVTAATGNTNTALVDNNGSTGK